MLEKDITEPATPIIRLRALVVDPNDSRRDAVTTLLKHQGMKVLECATVDHGRQLFDDHAMVVAPLNGDNSAVLEFVHWLRTRSGRTQPYVLGIGEYEAPASEWHGFNEFVAPPIDSTKVLLCVEAARRWHGWTAEINQPVAPQTPDAFKHHVTETPVDPEEPAAPATDDDNAFDWNAIVAEVTCAEPPVPTAEATQPPVEAEISPPAPEPEPAPVAPVAPPPQLLPETLPPSLATQNTQEMSPDLHQQITEASPFGLLLLDDASNVIYANPQHRSILGFTIAEAGGLAKWLERGCAAEPKQRKATLDSWWEHVWRRRVSLVLTMRSAESLLKEIEFRPSPLADERLLVAIFDVTDARREEESMRTSEARFRSLFAQSPYGLVVVNTGGNITDASTEFEKMAGCSRLDMRRLGIEQFFSEEDLIQLRKQTFSARQGKSVRPLLVELLPRSGKPIPLTCTISIIKNSSGAAVFTAYSFQEFVPPPNEPPTPASLPSSTPMPAETSSAPKLNRLISAIPDLVLEVAADTVIQSYLPSRDFQFLMPQSVDFVGKSFADAFPALSQNLPLVEMMTNLEESLDSEVRCEFKVRLKEDEEPRFCEARMVALNLDDKEKLSTSVTTKFGIVIRDISRSVFQAKPEPKEEPKAGSFGFSATQLLKQAVIVTNEKGRITDLNPAAERLFGYAKEELLDSGLYKLFLPDQPKEFAAKISDHLNRFRCWIGKSSFYRKDGTSGRVAIELVPYEEQEHRGFFGLLRDLSDEPKSEPAPAAPPTPAPPPAPPVPAAPAEGGPTVTLHRARNDLQVISSLLSMQASDENMTEGVRQALHEGKDRVGAIALVYRLLDGETGLVNFSHYAAEISGQLLRSNGIEGDRIRIIPPSEPTKINQKLAITLGLILQELINSVLRFSFPNEARGTVEIKLLLGKSEGILSLKDDGPFQTEDVLAKRIKGFGWQVVEALSSQIRGELKVLSDLDNEIRLRFRLDGTDLTPEG